MPQKVCWKGIYRMHLLMCSFLKGESESNMNLKNNALESWILPKEATILMIWRRGRGKIEEKNFVFLRPQPKSLMVVLDKYQGCQKEAARAELWRLLGVYEELYQRIGLKPVSEIVSTPTSLTWSRASRPISQKLKLVNRTSVYNACRCILNVVQTPTCKISTSLDKYTHAQRKCQKQAQHQ